MRRFWLEAGLYYAAFVWGATFLVVKDALRLIDPAAMVGWRFVWAALLLAPAALSRPSPGRLMREGILLGAMLILLYVPQTAGLRYTSAANSGFITGLFIVFVPIFLLLFFGRRPEPGQWLAVGLAVAGLWLLTGGMAGINRGDALTLVAAMSYAAHLLATDRYVRGDADTVLLAFHQFWFTGLASLILAAAVGAPLGMGGARGFWTVLFLAVVPTLSAFFAQLLAQKELPALKVSLIFSLEPVFAAACAWTVGGEPFRPAGALGGLLIVAAMVTGELSRMNLLSGRRKEVLPV